MILFVSDGRPTDRNTEEESKEVILRVISQQNALLRNEVIIQTFGIGDGKITHSICHSWCSASLSCSNHSFETVVDSNNMTFYRSRGS